MSDNAGKVVRLGVRYVSPPRDEEAVRKSVLRGVGKCKCGGSPDVIFTSAGLEKLCSIQCRVCGWQAVEPNEGHIIPMIKAWRDRNKIA